MKEEAFSGTKPRLKLSHTSLKSEFVARLGLLSEVNSSFGGASGSSSVSLPVDDVCFWMFVPDVFAL